ncbi:dihydropteroate synthase [Terrimonas sp.]|uniref:dihydropteroate synthase n=1 Tax=Terrimonas sp. TaxID=1914338 RepID=UPI000D510926|nr:dihydropteroate synthase [Terrimonas sp.]PVD50382.1 dihydropteroate synthase [Terrimonas sp.]
MYTLNCKGKLLVIDKPVVMGIINITPDSFYEGSRKQSIKDIVEVAAAMLADGAAILDIGGQSTRPGSERLHTEQEKQRVLPAIEAIIAAYPDAIISIDTYNAAVAEEAVQAGAAIVNDISSGDMDEAMLPTVANLKVPYICMHMQGTPDNMQQHPQYTDVTAQVLDYLAQKADACKRAGINDIIIDPGFGFGKTIEHNFTLLRQLSAFKILNCPVLAGLSRKSTVYKTLGTTAENALNGTTVLNTITLMNGADILRVHDVKAAVEVITLFKKYDV